MNVLNDLITENVSKYIETKIKEIFNESKIIHEISEEYLFNDEQKVKQLETNIYFLEVLQDYRVKEIKKLLESYNINLYVGYYINGLMHPVGCVNGGSNRMNFYTNTNVKIEVGGWNTNNASVRIYSDDFDIQYGSFQYGSLNRYPNAPYFDLNEYMNNIYKYIDPRIYLDYYMINGDNSTLNELIHSINLKKEIECLKSEIVLLKQENSTIINKYTTSDCELINKNKIIETNEIEKTYLNSEFAELNQKLEEALRNNKQHETIIDSLNNDIASFKVANIEKDNTITILNKINNDLNSQITIYENKLENECNENTNYRKEIENKEETIDRLNIHFIESKRNYEFEIHDLTTTINYIKIIYIIILIKIFV